MAFELLFDFPFYWYIILILLSFGVSYLMYSKNTIYSGKKFYSWPVNLLMGLRTISIFICSLLLFSPLLKTISSEKIEPLVIVGIDNSSSILATKDSAIYKNQLAQKIEDLEGKIGKKFKVKSFLFSDKTTENKGINFQGKESNISGFYEEVLNRFGSRNIGAVLTLTDGIFNKGENPINIAEKINAPFYFVALGDTSEKRDAIIKNVRTNKIVYSGNKFPAQIQLKINGYKGKRIKVEISGSEGNVFQKEVEINSNSNYQEVDALILCKQAGYKKYSVKISNLEGEFTYQNNQFDFYIESLNSKRKILIIAKGPHPDVAAIKKSIERNEDYQANSFTLQEYLSQSKGNFQGLKNYQLLILHSIPGKGNAGVGILNYCKENNIPYLLIVGSETDLTLLNNSNSGIKILPRGNSTNESFGAFNEQFSLFSIKENVDENLLKWPPLVSPFGDYSFSDGSENILLFQKIGKVKSTFPLWAFHKSGESKSGFICGEGIWKWYLNDFNGDQSFNIMDEMMNKTIQYLSNKADNRLLRVRPIKNIFYNDEKVIFEAEAFSPNFEPLNNAKISLNIINNETKKSFSYNFNSNGNGYSANLDVLKEGSYSYKAKASINGKDYDISGEFQVKKQTLEYLETTADHSVLRAMAKSTGGEVFQFSEIDKIAEKLVKRNDITPLLIEQSDVKELIHYKWIFFTLLLLLGIEWFLRKYFGTV